MMFGLLKLKLLMMPFELVGAAVLFAIAIVVGLRFLEHEQR